LTQDDALQRALGCLALPEPICVGGIALANSTQKPKPAEQCKPKKPRADFPLFPHATGRWAKKVRGKFAYFGKVADDPRGEAALKLWLDQKDELLAGRTPRGDREGLTVRELANHFLTAKEQQRDAGDIRPSTFADYYSTCKSLVEAFGKGRLVDDLAAEDFQALRARLARRLGPHALSREVQQIRTTFKYGYDAGLIDKPMRFGPTFKRPAKRLLRAHRQRNGQRMFEAAELRKIIDVAEQPLRAMILLGINCGFGNTDCGLLPKSALNLRADWVDFARPKTAIERHCPLWPDTVKAIQDAIKKRPMPNQHEHNQLVFLTKYGQPWAKDSNDNPITKEFRKLLDKLKLHRRGLGFYALRHTFETTAGESRDQVAVDSIMGHVDSSMAGVYRERIEDKRLLAVTSHVRKWLFPKRKAK
jgi:integrase